MNAVGTEGANERIAVLSGALRGWAMEDVFKALAENGVAAVELTVGDREPANGLDPLGLHALASAHGLGICGVAAPMHWPVGDRRLVAATELSAAVGGRFVRTFAPAYDPGVPPRRQLEQLTSDLDALRARTTANDVDLLVEVAQGTLVPSPSLARLALEPLGTERVGVVYDPANMQVEGHLQPDYAVAYLGPYLRHVHAKNTVLVRERGTRRPRRSPLDRGYVDWPAVAEALRRHDFGGYVSIDHLSGPPSCERLTGDVETLRRVLTPGAVAAGAAQ